MGNDNGCTAVQQPVQRPLDQHLGDRVHAGCSLVQDQDAWVYQRRAGNAQQLPLAHRQVHRSLQNLRLVTARQPGDKVMGVGQFGCSDDLCQRGIWLAIADIVGNAAGKEEGILRHQPKLAAQRCLLDGTQVTAVNQHLSTTHVIETGDQVGDGCLTGAGGADQRYRLPGLNV